jgi:hypothetical protein
MRDVCSVQYLALSWATLLASCLLASMPRHALAQPLPVALQYSAPKACPAESTFWMALAQRTRRVTRAEPSNAQVLLRVDLELTRQSVIGRLEIVRDGFATEPRYVEASDCAGVLQALALTAALGIDPEALTRPPDSEPHAEFSPSVGGEDKPASDYVAPVDAPDPLPSRPIDWRVALSFHLVGAQPVDLTSSWGASGAVILRGDRGTELSPTLSLGAAFLRSNLISTDDRAQFGLYTALGQGCPLRLASGIFEFRPCAVSQIGMISGEGQNVSDPSRTRAVWMTLGAAFEAELLLSDDVRAQLTFAAHAPLTPQSYSFGTAREELARTPALFPWVSLGFVNLL